jgi:hypothetical protein
MTYFLGALVLQLVGYTLAVAAGVNVGLSMFKPQPAYKGRKALNLFPVEALHDLWRLYLIALPFFFLGSMWEFLSSWNT